MEPHLKFFDIFSSQIYFNTISSFLPYKDLFLLSSLCKSFHSLCDNYLIKLLKDSGFTPDQQPQTTPSSLLRFLYYREVLTSPIPELKVLRNNKLGFKGIKDFSLGPKLSAFHLYNKDLLLFKTEELLSVSQDVPEQRVFKSIKRFSTNSKSFVFLTEGNQVFLVNETPGKLSGLEPLKIVFPFAVNDIAVSYYNMVLMVKDIEIKNEAFVENPIVLQGIKEMKSPFCFFLVSFAELEAGTEPCKALRLFDVGTEFQKEVRNFCLGRDFAYFVNEKFEVFQGELAVKGPVIPLIKYANLGKKRIEKVFAGLFYYFAIEREEHKSLEGWNNEKVVRWADEIGFSDWSKILKYENITGEELAVANKTYLIDTLGMHKYDIFLFIIIFRLIF